MEFASLDKKNGEKVTLYNFNDSYSWKIEINLEDDIETLKRLKMLNDKLKGDYGK